MTSVRLKTLAVVLIAVFIGSGLIGTVAVLSAKPVARCHVPSHSKSTPISGYQCCAAGHNFALQPNVSDAFVVAATDVSVISPTLIDSEHPSTAISDTTASPPLLIALRI